MAEVQLSGCTLRVATYNVHDCVGRDGVYVPERIAAIVAELRADLVALQEITLDHAGDVVALLERTTAMQAIDGTLFERGVGRYGNLLLSRAPVAAQGLHDISFAGREPRGLLRATVAAQGTVYVVLATHLGLSRRERRQQIRKIVTLLPNGDLPVILMGDFNIWEGSSAFSPLTDLGFIATGTRSYPTWSRPVLPLDRILVRRPGRILTSWHQGGPLARIASDHFPVVANVEVAPLEEATRTI
ncbi:MAG: endonuclease/exonuclease/phosphatase family protein [Chromatiaceae bacterium]|nr:endonuclease/exonuclease/phosphatase family protein [Chromatiaceae bacterium]